MTYSGLQARLHDPDRYLLSLLAKPEKQADIWPLLAFNYEIARTREVVTEANIGLIRLQWWRDALEKIYAGESHSAQNEVAAALKDIIGKYQLPLSLFESLLHAREFDLENVAPDSLAGLVHYADLTHTPLLQLIQMITGEPEECRGSAISYSLAGLMAAIVFHARQNRCYLPADLMLTHQVQPGLLFDLKIQPGLPGLVEEICNQASIFLFSSAPRARFLKGMDRLTSLHLKRMKACGYDPFDQKWVKPVPFRELRVAWAAR